MVTIREYYPYHTDFAEDLLGYPYGEPLVFHYDNKCYISEPININRIFLHAKEKWNYKNDEPHYFENNTGVKEIRPYYIYFNVKEAVFFIPLEQKEPDKDTIEFGVIKDEEKPNLDLHEKYIRLEFIKGYKPGIGISDDESKYYSKQLKELLKLNEIEMDNYDIMTLLKIGKYHEDIFKIIYNKLKKYDKLTKDQLKQEIEFLTKELENIEGK